MLRRHTLSLALAGAVAPLRAQPEPLVFVAPTNLGEPWFLFVDGQPVEGLLLELGEAVARQLGRRATHLSVPSRRVAQVLSQGEADMVCYVLPPWLLGDFVWTEPVLPNADVLVARANAAAVRQLADLRGQRVGTITGYTYRHLLAPGAGLPFLRDDALDTRALLAKLEAGRTDYALIEQATLNAYLARTPASRLRLALMLQRFTAHCAISRRSRVPAEQLQRAVHQLQHDGSVRRLYQRWGL